MLSPEHQQGHFINKALSASYRLPLDNTAFNNPRVSHSALPFSADEKRHGHPDQVVSERVEKSLTKQVKYESCKQAFYDVLLWFTVLYGDWFGNEGGNTLGYYMYALMLEKVPKWVSMCYSTTTKDRNADV